MSVTSRPNQALAPPFTPTSILPLLNTGPTCTGTIIRVALSIGSFAVWYLNA
jgi:hypothetical protein